MAGTKATGSKKGKKAEKNAGKRVNVRKETKAGLIFSVSRCSTMMKRMRLSRTQERYAPVFMAAVLQFLCTELFDMAGEVCAQKKKKTISPQHLQIAARNDEEFMKLMGMTQISQGGTNPFVHAALFPGKKGVTHGNEADVRQTQTL